MKVTTGSVESPLYQPLKSPSSEAPSSPDTSGFGDVISDAVAKVEATQAKGDADAAKLAAGDGNLHEAALSLEKADISMRLMVKARNKIVEAYQEIMRMPV